MGHLRASLAVLLLTITTLFFSTLSHAASPTASTFVLPDDNGGKSLVFALNVPKTGDDLFFHMSGPMRDTWQAVGFGSQMKGSLAFIVYSNANKDNVTASPRIAAGNYEPTYTSDSRIVPLAGSGIIDGMLVLNAQCIGCRKWSSGALDVNSNSVDMIYSLGPSTILHDNSPTASLRRHRTYGFFKMDLKAATGEPGVPFSQLASAPGAPSASNGAPASTAVPTSSGAVANGSPKRDRDITLALHAVLMGITFVFIIPIGVVLIRIFGKVRLHYLNNSFAFFTVLIGLGLGIAAARGYGITRNYDTPHQIIGFVVVSAIVVQIILGATHHAKYKKQGNKTIMGTIHRFFGPAVLILGLVNGILGFLLAGHPYYIIGYVLLIVIVLGLILGLMVFKRRRAAKKGGVTEAHTMDNYEAPPQGAPEGYQARYDGEGKRMG